MLIINKKLSKKIKFPLSLRSYRSNLNGFSLIELMVAVVILALAIFGIFHAYSVGFMGMADARDRTVATNYAREAMEDIKNKDFDKIITQSRQFIPGTKFEREVIVQESTNLKKVITKVYWLDRNGNKKMVKTSMAIHFIETTASAPVKIILYANPYNVLTSDNTDTNDVYENRSIITAVVKDEKGNTVTAYNDEITFSITVGNAYGSFQNNSDTYTVSANKGIATATFTASSEGEVTITASSGALTEDSVVIKITNPEEPVKINLTADPVFMPTGSISTITATIVNAAGGTVEISKEITFSVSGPGTLSTPTTLSTVDEYGNPTGIAIITLTSNGTPGTITVTSSSTDLEPGVVDVITGGKISLSAPSTTVPLNEKLEITVTTKDVNSVPINYVGDISLSIGEGSTGSGNLPSEPVHFDGSSSSMTVDFTAGGPSDTIVNVNADDQAGILTSAVPLPLHIIEELVPDHIEVYAIPSSIPAGGTKTSKITAKVVAENNSTITSYINDIIFTTTTGSFTFGMDNKNITLTNSDENYNDGIATVELYSSDIPETAEITVSSTVSVDPEHIMTGSTEVGFYIGPDHIFLSADPQNILVDGKSCIVTAKIVDYNETVISDYNEDIAFNISPHPETIKFLKATTAFLVQKVKKGIATVTLISGNVAGTAIIDAYSGDLFGSLNIPVGDSSLTLVGDPSYALDGKTVSFDINIMGEDLLLKEMQVSWDSPIGETINKISILHTDDSVERIIFNTESVPTVGSIVYTDEPTADPNLRIADIDVDDVDLSTGVSNVKIYFSGDMSDKSTLDVTFNPNSGDYLLHLKQ